MSDSDTEQVNHLVPADVKERAKEHAEYGELSEAVRDVYRIYASAGGSGTLAQLEIKLRKTRREKESIQERIDALNEELTEVKKREAELQAEIRNYQRESTEYERLLCELDELLVDGAAVFESHAKVQNAASVGGVSTTEVIDDLRERNPDLPDSRFEEGSATAGVSLSAIET